MLDLLKTDLKRVLKDKLFTVTCIIAAVFSVVMPLLYKVLYTMVELPPELGEMGGLAVDAKSLCFTTMMPGDNFGLILSVLLAIILCKEFGQGTIRNKIICGRSRTAVFLSLLCTCAIVLCGVMVAYGVLTLCVSLCLFDYQHADVSFFQAAGYLLLSFGFEMVTYAFVAAMLTFFIVVMKNAGLAVVLYVAAAFFCTLVGGIVGGVMAFANPANELLYNFLQILTDINMFTSAAIGRGTAYSVQQVLCILLPCLLGGAGFVALGLHVFKKKDIK
ncbi:MAG: hypothetical protein IJB97_06735 [Clostridia bacterium]|nr:hypothetical protein [Clostridia bacterium]